MVCVPALSPFVPERAWGKRMGELGADGDPTSVEERELGGIESPPGDLETGMIREAHTGHCGGEEVDCG